VLSPGVILQQRYRITRLLARGGMGAVYEAEAVHLRNATVAVAVKETFFGEDRQSLREQFEREAATLARLRHPALPQVKDHFIEGGGQFLVMDFIEGDDLDTLLERRLNEIGSPFGFRQVMEWAERLLDALGYIHGQYPPVIHRDIKPQNLKLTPRAELFLIDFGLAKDATTPTSPGNSLHAYTLEFAPPEQIKGEGTDARSDIYSLGATLRPVAPVFFRDSGTG
jgi:serine/threonine protein kinase